MVTKNEVGVNFIGKRLTDDVYHGGGTEVSILMY